MLSAQISGMIDKSSVVRKMFETGIEMKARHGAENVFDFSLGNPDLPPPAEVVEALTAAARTIQRPFGLGYMPNAGYPETREALASFISAEHKTLVEARHVVATCGAAGAINIFLKAVIDPGDEVVCPSPYFVEYVFYAANFGGVLRPVKPRKQDFGLDLDALEATLSERTRVVLLNSPNNPSGRIYSIEETVGLSELLRKHSKRTGKVVYLLSDEPYRFLNYDSRPQASVLHTYEHSVLAGSFSKSHSMAGARIGYLAVNPAMPAWNRLVDAATLTSRTLGFVNAPAMAQKVIAACVNAKVDIGIYRERRDAMASILHDAGIEFILPEGAFYFFPASPTTDERTFIDRLLSNRVLAVPGSGFGVPGHFRLAFCVDKSVIERSRPAFLKAVEELRS